MVSDKVGDFIIRLQNAARIGKRSVSAPYSAHLVAIARKLKELGFLSDIDTPSKGDTAQKAFSVTLAYGENGAPRLRGVKRVSKPGRRLYMPHTAAHRVKGGMGARIISSPSGIVSDREARENRVGGESLFEIW